MAGSVLGWRWEVGDPAVGLEYVEGRRQVGDSGNRDRASLVNRERTVNVSVWWRRRWSSTALASSSDPLAPMCSKAARACALA